MLTRVISAIVSLFCVASAQDLKVFFGNLHSHTSYSDGSGKPADAYRHARLKARIDFLAISEHNHTQAESGAASDRKDGILIAKDHSLYTGPKLAALIPAARKATVSGKFLALYGQEFSSISKGNHVNVFDVDKVIDVKNGDFKGLVQWLAANPDSTGQPPVIQFNHPELFSDDAIEYGADDFDTPAEWISEIGKFVRLVEIVNGPAMTKTPAEAPRAEEDDFMRILNLGFRVAPTADQDNHYFTWGDASPARTGVVAAELTKPAILEALRRRHVYASEDSNLRMVFRVNGNLMGEVIAPPALNQELSIEFTVTDDDEPDAHYEIDVLSDTGPGGESARVIETVTFDGDSTVPVLIEDIRFVGEGQYLFFRVRQFSEDGGADRVWTAPVWFDSLAGATALAASAPAAPDLTPEAIASRRSKLFHISEDCVDARRIKPANRLSGDAARRGRRRHQDCPRREP
jgi:hypothetical protein